MGESGMGDWTQITDFGLTGILILGIIYVIITYLKTMRSSKAPVDRGDDTRRTHTCSDSLQYVLSENTKVISELVIMFKQQHEVDREWIKSNQVVLNGLVIALNNVIAISKEILDRVKEIDRRKDYDR